MKNLALFIAFITLTFSSIYAQEEIFAIKLKKDNVPTKVIASIERDFPATKITDYSAVPVEVVGNELIVNASGNSKDFDSYKVMIDGRDFFGSAIYDKNGKLLYSNETLKDVPLPYTIRYAIGKNYPGWAVEGDREVITTYRDDNQKSYYHIKLAKGKEKMRVTLDAHGNIMSKHNDLNS